jgi:hypothetical protein
VPLVRLDISRTVVCRQTSASISAQKDSYTIHLVFALVATLVLVTGLELHLALVHLSFHQKQRLYAALGLSTQINPMLENQLIANFFTVNIYAVPFYTFAPQTSLVLQQSHSYIRTQTQRQRRGRLSHSPKRMQYKFAGSHRTYLF